MAASPLTRNHPTAAASSGSTLFMQTRLTFRLEPHTSSGGGFVSRQAASEGLTLVHSSAQHEHFLWGTLVVSVACNRNNGS